MARSSFCRHAIDVSFSFSDSLPSEKIIVAEDVWSSLLFTSHNSSPGTSSNTIVVSLTFHGLNLSLHQCTQRCNLVWVGPPQNSQHAPPLGSIFISRELNSDISQGNGISSCSLAVVVPERLTEVVMTISSVHLPTSEELIKIEQYLHSSTRLFRSGHVFQHDSTNHLDNDFLDTRLKLPRLEIAMSEPVSQGFCVPAKTRLLFASKQPDTSISQTVSRGQIASAEDSCTDDEFMIDENFLASTALRSMGGISINDSMQSITHDEGYPIAKPASFSAETLPSCSIQDVHDSHVVFVSIEDMGQLGIFNGDWCIITSADEESRLVQVFGLDVPERQRIYASSQFLYNCGSAGRPFNAVSVQAAPFHAHPLPVSIAQTVTLARVASPLLLDKSYYSPILKSLKKKLEVSRCLIKTGDVIGVVTDAHNSWKLVDDDDDGRNIEDVNEAVSKRAISEEGHLCDTVYFVVSNAESDIAKSDEPGSRLAATPPSTFVNLGYWIDPSSTRVVQTGVVHRSVPSNHYDELSSHSGFDTEAFSAYFTKLHELVAAALSRNAVMLGLDLVVLLKGAVRPAMHSVVEAVANHLGFHLVETSAFDIIGESEAKTEANLREEFDSAMSCSPCMLLLKNIDGLMRETQTDTSKEHSIVRVFDECISKLQANWHRTGYPVLTIATTDDADHLPASILSTFKHEIDFEVPDDSSRHALLKSLLDADSLAADMSLKELSLQTAAFTDNDIIDLVSQMRLFATERALDNTSETFENVRAIHDAGVTLNSRDTDKALDKARTSFSQNIGAPSIPKVSWDDVGGLAEVKQDILDTIQLPLENPSLFSDGLKKRSGILLYGPPGTGKTLVAKAVATTCSLNFLSVKGPELLNMYIGESEANVRRVFQQARKAKPCVIFFDELDSIAPKRGNLGDSGGVMDRIVSQLLAELDGMSSPRAGADVFVIGATNRPDLLDPALLRPGRFDRLLYLGVSSTHEAQLSILKALTRKFRLDPQLDLMEIAEQCPFNYTGADFYALCSDAMLKAMGRKARSVEEMLKRINEGREIPNQHYPLTPQYYLSELASPSDTEVIVSQVDFKCALKELVPSVSQAEMEHYKDIQKRFSEGFESRNNGV